MNFILHMLMKLRHLLLRFWFYINSKKHSHTIPQPGITIIAHLTGTWSFGKVMRDLAFSLKDAGIPFQTFNIGARKDVPAADVDPILTPRREFNIRKYDHIIDIISSPSPNNIPGVVHSTAFFWEFDSGFIDAWPTSEGCNSVIAFSDFNRDIFRKALSPSCDVRKILYPFRFSSTNHDSPQVIRSRYGIPADAFAVFFNFSYSSGLGRKNPDGAIRAFSKAFRNEPNVRLVFKTMAARHSPDKVDQIRRLAQDEGILDRLISIDNYVPQKDLYGLTAACDAYISLHRGEGFGLGIAEAMSLGKPVIVTDYSSTKEFCNADNACLIPYQMVKPREDQIDCAPFKFVSEWPEPNINAAAEALIRLRNDLNFRHRIGENAKCYINSHFSRENFRQSVLDFLSA